MRPAPFACAFAVASMLLSQVEAHDQAGLILRNVTVIDGHGGSPVARQTLVIHAGRIATISGVADEPRDATSQWLDLTGHYAIPALVDAHVHLSIDPGDPTGGLEAAFLGGVLSVRDMGGDEALVRRLAERSHDAKVAQPRIYFATAVRGIPPIDAAAGRLGFSRDRPAVPLWLRNVVTDDDNARAVVARAKARGATGVKLYSDFPLPLLRELCALAKHAGLRVWGHARVSPHRPSDGVEAGIEVLSHSSQLAFEQRDAPEHGDVYRTVDAESPAVTALLHEMRVRGTILEPTLYASYHAARGGGAHGAGLARVPTVAWASAVTRLAHRMGVTLVAGTDRLNEQSPGRAPNIHAELELLVSRGGLTPLEAITAATRTAAQVLGNDDSYGTIAVGKRADVVILRADPSADIRNTRRVAFVIKAGVVHQVKRGWPQL